MRRWRRLARALVTVLAAAAVATAAIQAPGLGGDESNSPPTRFGTTYSDSAYPDNLRPATPLPGAQPADPAPPAPTSATSLDAPELTADVTPLAARTWGPSGDQWMRALADARALPLAQAAGQVIVPHWDSPNVDGLTDLMARGNFGGVILMGGAVTTADALAELTAAVQLADDGRPWGTVISTDQEGGTVARLQGIVPDVPGFMSAGAARDKVAVQRAYREAAVDMRALGVTMDFAPVADMTIGMADPIIRTRSAGDTADNVAQTIETAVAGYVAGGVVPVIKHFPGHGSVTVDSHNALPLQSAPLATLEQRDLVPFARASAAGAPAVMMGHIALSEWDSLPATLAPKAYDYLRGTLGFDGVAVTDALNMGAITATYSPGQAAVAALNAGADMLLMPADAMAARDAIVAAVESGDVNRERLDEAAARIIALQRWQRSLGPLVDTGANYGRDLAVAGVTVAAKACASPFVTGPIEVVGGRAVDRTRLASALAGHGLEAVAVDEIPDDDAQQDNDKGVPKGAANEPVTTVAFVGGDANTSTPDVAIATGSPWVLEGYAADVLVALYGNSADALAGLADVLAGLAAPGGMWPVAIDLPFGTCG